MARDRRRQQTLGGSLTPPGTTSRPFRRRPVKRFTAKPHLEYTYRCSKCGAGSRASEDICAACRAGRCAVGWARSRCRGSGEVDVFLAEHTGARMCKRHAKLARPTLSYDDDKVGGVKIGTHWILEYTSTEDLSSRALGELRQEIEGWGPEEARRKAAKFLGCAPEDVTLES